MKTYKKLVSLLLCALCVLLCVPISASASETNEVAWAATVLEQCAVTVPEVNAYLYPLDQNGNVIYGLTENSINIEAKLDSEKLSIKSFKNAKEKGCVYEVLLNVSTTATGTDYLRAIKNELSSWIDALGENDRFLLITYANEYSVLLDGTETRDAAKRVVENIKGIENNANTIPAMKEAIRLTELEENGEPERCVLVMYDNGVFLQSGEVVIDELSSSFADAGLPLYTMCNYPYDDLQIEMSRFASATGGNSTRTNAATCKAMTEQLRSRLNSCYVLEMEGTSNALRPRERLLDITFSAGGTQNVQASVLVEKNIPDNEPPTLKRLSCEDEKNITLVFSEAVSGADNVKNYTVTKANGGSELAIESVKYDEDACTATLTMKKAMDGGDYLLEIKEIIDASYEGNAFVFPDGGEQYEFSVDGKSAAVWMIVGAAVLVCVAVAIIIAADKKKKFKAERERIAAERAKAENAAQVCDPHAAQSPMVKFSEDRAAALPVTLTMVLPNGLKSRADVTVRDKFAVGRSEKRSDLSINDEMISGLHMLFGYSQGRLTVTDAGSTNGTFVNGIKIDKPRVLQSGDSIVIGKTKISVKF